NVKGLDYYSRVIDALLEAGIEPAVTLYHWDLPQALQDEGGWANRDIAGWFGEFAAIAGETFGDRVARWITLNEPQVVASNGHALGWFPPGHRDIEEATRVNSVLAAAHRTATAALRAGKGNPRVGTCLQLPFFEPRRADSAEDVATADLLRSLMVDAHIDDLRAGGDVGDFVGLQYYTRAVVDASAPGFVVPPSDRVETTQMGWEVYPEGFGKMLRRISETGLPVVVTENGIATADDRQRVRYLASHLREVQGAIESGVDVRGYMYWSSFDNFEWAHGYAPLFGLVGIDRSASLRRVVRPSAVLFGEVAGGAPLPADDL
ncbi:MAG TPA: family 1 glycosylhydrolase, partial [Acidimicrobiales bacterium]|nr:family 1 glycosylhydrolase [Acidimicrobiales bacterium]